MHAATTAATFDPLHDADALAGMIASVTNVSPEQAMAGLRAEYADPGSTVAKAAARAGVTPHVWSPAMEAFYSSTDAFIYELAVWSRNQYKRRMLKWTLKRLASIAKRTAGGAGLDVLCFGEGLGFDALALAAAGHRVTYFELPGLSERFARELFARAGANIKVTTSTADLPRGGFDVVWCFDVLEHVPDAAGLVGFLKTFLRPAPSPALLIANSPFWLIHRAYATHLRANARHAGSLALYQAHGFRVVAARATWDPILLSATLPPNMSPGDRLAFRTVGLVLACARTWPEMLGVVHVIRCKQNRWFE